MDTTMDRLGKSLILIEEEEYSGRGMVWGAQRGGFCLVGRLLASRIYKFDCLRSTRTSVVILVKGMNMKEIGENRFRFKFNHIIGRNRVMEGCPWNFEKKLLLLNIVEDDDNPLHRLELVPVL
ncbi:hypothetical protein Salat_0212000, partial [Sesamum alatum]